MKIQTAIPEVLDYPTSSVKTIDLRIDKKEYEILTEDCTCIIDEVEFVKIIDLETNMPLPVVAAPQPTTTATPRKGMHKFLSRLLNRLSVLPLTLPLCLVLVLGVGNVWGQTILTFEFSALAGNEATANSNFNNSGLTSSTISRGTGLTAAANAQRYNASSWATTSIANAVSGNDYMEFTITPNSGKQFSVSSIVVQWQRSSTGNTQIALRSSVDNYSSDLDAIKSVTDNPSTQTFTWTFAQANSSTAVTYRFYSYAESTSGTGGPGDGTGNDITVNGSVSDVASAPTLTSPTVSSITTTSATLGATVSSNGGAALSERGTVWGTTASPTGNSLAASGTTVDAFTHSRTGLTANTFYYYRGYATNTAGTGYSADGTFTTLPLAPTVGTGSSATASGFTANWSHPTMGSASYTYSVEVDDNSDFSSITTTVPSISSSSTTQAITSLASSTTYYYRVKAVNAQGSSDWSSTSAGIATSAAVSPTLNPVTLASALSSTYGTASAGVSFTASGSNLTGNITATAQSGYEVSTDNSSFVSSVSVAEGTTVYVRFASTISAGDKNTAIAVVLSGGGASSSANVTTSSSGNTVSQKALTVTGLTAENKVYDGITTATATGTAALSGVVGADVVSLTGTPTFTFSSANVGTGISVTISGYSLTGGDAANYTLTQPTLSANITVRSLTITANDVNKFAGVALTGGAGSSAFTSSGLQNGETIGSVTITYGSAGATTGDGNTVGVYASQVTPSAATGGTFTASNYSISYVAGSITVTAAPCATESFGNIGSSTTYGSRTWSGSGGTWNATDAREDQTINGKAITIRNGIITSPSISGGIGDLTLKAKFPFSESSGNLSIKVNGDVIGTLLFSEMNGSSTITKTISNINIVGNIILTLESTGTRYCIDDISWTCYSAPEINLKQSSTNLASGSGSYSFGTETVGSTSSAVTFTIENIGTETLNLTGSPKVAISGHTSDFTINQASTSATVAASGSTTFTVSFSPTTTGARSATISIANNDSNENPYTFSVTGTGATYAPSVTTSAATSITTTGATLNGEVTSDGGATITERGFVYKTSSGVTISDNKTTVAGTTGVFSLSPSSLSVNTRYYFRAYATNSVNTTLGSELDFWTLANVPTAPTVNTPTGSSLNVTIGGSDGNPATTTYAIQETTSGNYVQANGSLSASAVWQTASTWSAITVIGLSSATTYTFQVKARNGANTETAFGSTANGTTSSIGLNAVILSSALTSTYGSVSSGVSFTASGTNLTSNITATAQSGYQVSTDNSSFGSSVSVASGTTVYVRFASTLSAGNYNNQVAVVLSGGGASSSANVTTSLSGNTVSKATPTINSSPTATAITYGQTLASSTLTGGSASVAGSFDFTSPSTAPNAGTANQSVTFTPTDNSNYNTTTTNVSVTVNKANQTITFGALADKTTADSPFALTGTASSGLTVSYSSSNTGVATVAGSTVTIVGAGQTTISASQAGDANFNAASGVDQTLTVTIPACVTNSNQTGGWNFNTASPSTTVTNLNIGDLSQGNNNGTTTLINGTSASSGYSGASGGNNAGASARTGALNISANGSAYFEFTLTPANGYNFILTGISFGSRSTSTGPQAYALRSSLDSYAADITTGSLSNNSAWALLSNTGLNTTGQGNANPVTFRLYGYNGSGSASANTANWRIDDLTLTLTVSNAPSAATVGSTQNLCGTLTSSALGGNTPALGTGTWSQTSGPGTSTFSALNSGNSTATASVTGTYVYKWAISNGCATVNEASVTVNYNVSPSNPAATITQPTCSVATGTITITSQSNVEYSIDNSTYQVSNVFSGLSPNTYTIYVKSITTGNCVASTGSQVVNVQPGAPGIPSAPTASAQSLCSGSTVADLTVTSGSSIKWYDAASNGNLLAGGTALAAGNYYASQTVSGCESTSRTSVAVTINSTGTWIGGASGNWNVAGNWCGGVPNSNSAVVSVPTGTTINLDASPEVSELTIASTSVINSGSNNITIANGGSFTNNGTFNSQTGTVVFAGTGTLSGNATTFNNLTTNGNLTVSASPTINGTLTLNSGTLTVGANTLTINGSISRTSGNIDASNASATVVFGGSTAQTIPASTFTGNINNLTLNNSAGLSINQDISVVNTLTLTSGKLTLGSNHLTLGLNATIGGTPSASNMIIASGDGELRKRFSTANLDAFTFPVGTGTSYTPVVLDFNSGTFGAEAYMRVRVKNEKSSFLNSNISTYLNRNWIVEPNEITDYSYKIQLHYVDADFVTDGSLAEGNLLPIKNSSGQWYQPTDGSFTNALTQGSAGVFTSANYLEWNGLITFSEFGGAGGSNQPLPVELISFNALCIENQNVLSWQTASEHNSSHFYIEKSRDGETWDVIGQQTAAGNSNELLSYQFVDAEKNNTTAYYRLNQVDFDGKNEYFGPVAVNCEENSFEATTLPNPSNGNFWVKIQSNEGSSAELRLVDVKGNVLLTHDITIQEGMNVYPMSHLLESGMYFIQIHNTKDQKITVLKHLQN